MSHRPWASFVNSDNSVLNSGQRVSERLYYGAVKWHPPSANCLTLVTGSDLRDMNSLTILFAISGFSVKFPPWWNMVYMPMRFVLSYSSNVRGLPLGFAGFRDLTSPLVCVPFEKHVGERPLVEVRGLEVACRRASWWMVRRSWRATQKAQGSDRIADVAARVSTARGDIMKAQLHIYKSSVALRRRVE
jgi:hypothetical protein